MRIAVNVLLLGVLVFAGMNYYNQHTAELNVQKSLPAYLSGDYQTAYEYLTNAEMDKLGAERLYAMGDMLMTGSGGVHDVSRGLKYMKAAAEKGKSYAYFIVGDYYYGINSDYDTAVRWFNKGLENGCILCRQSLADFYYTGRGVKKDKEKSYKLYSSFISDADKLDKKFSPPAVQVKYMKSTALFRMATVEYENREYDKALEHFTASSELTNPAAANMAGHIYFYGLTGDSPDYKKASDWYAKAALGGQADAVYRLAGMYRAGQGVEKNEQLAAKYFQEAAENGVIEAYYGLGLLYEEGNLLGGDLEEAFRWFMIGAKKGCVDCMYAVSAYYEQGTIIDKNLKKAAYWMQSAKDAQKVR